MKIFIYSLLITSYLLADDFLTIGSKAPDFELPDAQGKIHKLSDYLNSKVVIYFYPKDGTPGCTKEACNLRDNYKTLQEIGIVILGISYDDAESHQKFINEHQLPFTLLSDTKKKVSELYGAKRGLLGFIGAKRITYLIDETGYIMHVFDEVDSGNHSGQIIDVITERDKNNKTKATPDTSVIE